MSVWQAWILPILAAGLGTLGFSVLFHIQGRRLALATLGGMLTWTCYLAAYALTKQEVMSYGLASVAASLYAHGMARLCRTPTTMFSLSATIPLIPGGSLYYTMQQAVLGEWRAFGMQGVRTLLIAAIIALGLIAGTWLDRSFMLLGTIGRPEKRRATSARSNRSL